MQADLLSLSRSSLYYQPRPPSAAEVQLKHRMDEIYTQYPFYGARKIAAQLRREGMEINRKTVGRYMNEMGIAAIYPGPNLSRRNHKEGVYPYLLRHLTSAYPNHVFSMDGKGRALDNIFTQRLWRTVKYEEVYLHEYTSPREARQGLTRYFEFYNQALENQTPVEVNFLTASAGQRQNE
jgi:putative transposase